MKVKKGMLARRDFVVATVAAGTALLSGCGSSRRGGWEFLSERDARTLKAICDQIIPADDFPSASQAGVVDFIDRQLVRHFRHHRSAYRDGLQRADALSRKLYGGELAVLTPARQLEVVQAIEQENRTFFELVRNHTLDGYYGPPRHGGNRDAVSWRMLGLAEPPVLGRSPSEQKKGPAS
ncbi:conserved exported hypothetical protein [Candidatus Sulfotelmatomonas gaucii]|uniref:Gluconate 2-dehydrogenase subunit 3 family protein n=1 Tax=Candidatus Sulfuritelmatomonas gaucii TaxID=2043161 RepID=A0A2N9L755_9BACT|nr:conserved exported hypothetical protein [Candidatus Sulfotelmatomonas gaucii]